MIFSSLAILTLITFQTLYQACITGMNPTWSWCIVFIHCWVLLANVLLKIFTSMFMRDISLWFFFLVMAFSDFCIRVMLAASIF